MRVELFDNEVDRISFFEPLTGQVTEADVARATIYPKTHYVTPREVLVEAIEKILHGGGAVGVTQTIHVIVEKPDDIDEEEVKAGRVCQFLKHNKYDGLEAVLGAYGNDKLFTD